VAAETVITACLPILVLAIILGALVVALLLLVATGPGLRPATWSQRQSS
jgi:hypothetical protein